MQRQIQQLSLQQFLKTIPESPRALISWINALIKASTLSTVLYGVRLIISYSPRSITRQNNNKNAK